MGLRKKPAYRPNLTKRKLAAAETVYGALLTVMNPELVEMLGIAGLDFIIMEGEHGPWDESQILNIVRASELPGITPTIRLSNLEPDRICRLLDMGVQGIHCSHVGSREEAVELVRVVKLYPLGERGFGRFSRANFYGVLDEREAVESANAESLVVAQIEDRHGIEHIDEILEVPGIDVVSVGPSESLAVVRSAGPVRSSGRTRCPGAIPYCCVCERQIRQFQPSGCALPLDVVGRQDWRAASPPPTLSQRERERDRL